MAYKPGDQGSVFECKYSENSYEFHQLAIFQTNNEAVLHMKRSLSRRLIPASAGIFLGSQL